MKSTLITLALALASTLAFAGGGQDHPPPPPKQQPAQPSSSRSDSSSSSGAGAIAGSRSGAEVNAPSSSTSAGGANSLGAVGNDNSQSSFRAYALALPQPAATPPLPATCPAADVTQSSRSFGWGLASWADSHSDTSDCTLMTLRREAHDACQFEAAQRLHTALIRKHLGADYPDSSVGWIDMSPDECKVYHEVHAPKVAETNYITQNFVSNYAAPRAAPRPAARQQSMCVAPAKPKPHQVRKPRACP